MRRRECRGIRSGPGTGTETGFGHPTVGDNVGTYALPVPETTTRGPDSERGGVDVEERDRSPPQLLLEEDLISHKVFLKSFYKSQFPHKSVILFFTLVIVKDKSTDLSGD